jgi:hypothetical protein
MGCYSGGIFLGGLLWKGTKTTTKITQETNEKRKTQGKNCNITTIL